MAKKEITTRFEPGDTVVKITDEGHIGDIMKVAGIHIKGPLHDPDIIYTSHVAGKSVRESLCLVTPDVAMRRQYDRLAEHLEYTELCCDLSTRHLDMKEMDLMCDKENGPGEVDFRDRHVFEYPEGFVVREIPALAAAVREGHAEWADDLPKFAETILALHERGFRMANFDADAPIVPGLTTYKHQ